MVCNLLTLGVVMIIKYTKLGEDAIPFAYSREGDACMDIYAYHDCVIFPNSISIVRSGIAVEIPEGYEGIVRGRSGMACNGIFTHVGTIDSNYRGEVGVILFNLYSEKYYIRKGERIAQFCIKPVTNLNLIFCEKLSETIRGEAGYGSSGK